MNDNETVAEIVKELHDDAIAVADDWHDEDVWTNLQMMEIYHSLAARIEAAHKREVEKLVANLAALEKATKVAGQTAESVAKGNNELRGMLRSACVELCHACPSCNGHPDYECYEVAGKCFVQEWRKAVGLNGGKEKENKEAAELRGGEPASTQSSQPVRPPDVRGGVDLAGQSLTALPPQPLNVGWNFDCSHNQLASLDGAPQTVGGSFFCDNNKLTSLDGAPVKVGGAVFCDNNPGLTRLQIDDYRAFLAAGGNDPAHIDETGHYCEVARESDVAKGARGKAGRRRPRPTR